MTSSTTNVYPTQAAAQAAALPGDYVRPRRGGAGVVYVIERASGNVA